MANVVSIQIKVDSGQALPAIDAINNALGSVGIKGDASFKKAGDSAKGMGGHITTSLDSVRLLSQEFGFRLPRALESMLARVPAVTNALGGLVGVMAGVAGAEVFARVAEGAYKAEQEYISLNAQADKFYETLKKTQQEDVANTRSIETTRRRLDDATGGATNSNRAAAAFHGGGFSELAQGNIAGGIADLMGAHSLSTDAVTNQSNMIKLGKVDLDQTHARALAQIELNHALDASLGPAAKITADLQKKKQIAAENREFDRKQEMYYGNPSPGTAGSDEERLKNQTAGGEATAQDILLARKERDERIAAQNAAINAGLEGEAKYVSERDQAIDAITRKYNDGQISTRTARSVTASLEEKYDNERDARLQKQIEQAQQMMREAQQSGLKGGALISAQHDNAIDRINSDRTLDPQAAALQRQAASVTATQKMSELEDQFSDHVNSLTAGRTEASLQAFDRIEAGAQKEVADLRKLYDDEFKDAQLTDAQKLQAEQNLQKGIAAIDAAAAQQKQQLAERNSQEDLRYSQEAAQAEARVREDGLNGWIASYRNGIASIEAMEQQRLAKLQQDVVKEGLTQQEAAQRKADIERTANAEIEQQNQQMQHQIAGDLQAAFTNPAEFIKSRMEKMFFEIIAAWIMRMNAFKTLFGQTMGSLHPGANGTAGSLLGAAGSLVPGTRGIVNGQPSLSSIGISGGATGAQSASGAIGAVSSIANTVGSLPGFGTTSSSSTLSLDPLLKNAQASQSVPGNDSYTADISNAQAQDAINSGTIGSQSTSAAASKMMGVAGAGFGAYTAATTTIDAFEKGDPLKGAMGDAAAGASIGMLAGPVGALIGAGVGAAVGATAGLTGMVSGEAGKLSARDYYQKSVFPQLEAEMRFNGDFQTAASNVGNTASQALTYMKIHFGQDAAAWVQQAYMQKEVTKVLSSIEGNAAGGRQYTTLSASQFHSGGTIGGFGSLATSSDEGFIHAMLNETVMTPQATRTHGPALNAMLGGAGVSDIAAMYLAGSKPTRSASGAPSGDTHHWTVNAMDAKSFSHFLRNGGAQQIVKHTNSYAAQYAGDGISG